MSMRLVQLVSRGSHRIAMVEEPSLRFVEGFATIVSLAEKAIASGKSLVDLVTASLSKDRIDYDAVYSGQSEWQLLPPIGDSAEESRVLVSGTGLTHLGSARNRQTMHSGAADQMTDSMKMFHWGVEGGKPTAGAVGTSPEWFYKGTGAVLRAHNEPLEIPAYAEDGGEEAEIAGIYLIGREGRPYRVGMAIGNEFSDHRFEKRNYLNLAGSKLRSCSIGPEIVINPQFKSVPGEARIERGGAVIWSKSIATGEDEMCHSLANIEHHHFKFEGHRRPGTVHVHYYGAHSLSFGDGVELIDGDIMQIEFTGFGRALRNPLRRAGALDRLVTAIPLT